MKTLYLETQPSLNTLNLYRLYQDNGKVIILPPAVGKDTLAAKEKHIGD
tara:strand:+ start:1399 stop:1545 length:147 start_codon:yes stop_codon:yes gene_type:complete